VAVLQQFGILFSLGSLGILLFVVTSIPLAQQQLATLSATTVAELPPLWVILVVQGLQYALLLAIAIVIGIFCTRSVGLHSHLIDQWVLHRSEPVFSATELKWSLGLGAATTLIVVVADYLLKPVLPEALQTANQTELSWLNTLTAVLYGGITEELLMRWGLMSLLIWLGWKLFKQGVTLPSHAIYQGAIVIAALVFGLLHLPMTASLVPLTHWVILRAILLNGVAGVACGWLFWQYSLEAAMITHTSFHVFLFILNCFLK
jgi:membrane protease YdiL (CAAX protease family)